MEVHRHSHAEPGKKFIHYFFEFFMLFLAVFCGFLVENYREHLVERHREEQFIISMIGDLKKDTANASNDVREYNEQILLIDSVFKNFDLLSSGYNNLLYEQLIRTQGYPDFIYNDETMQQLKSAGNMRLIRNKTALDSMLVYDSNIRDYMIDTDILVRIYEDYMRIFYEIIDMQKRSADLKSHTPEELEKAGRNYLITKDSEKLSGFRNKLQLMQGYYKFNIGRETEIKEKAVKLIQVLKKEYELE